MYIVIPIVPTAQARPRFSTQAGFVRAHKSKDQIDNERTLESFLLEHRPAKPLEGAICLGVRAYLPIPVSKSKKWKAQALAGWVRPTVKPDLDNIIKQIKDAMTRLQFWRDDKQVVEFQLGTGKYYDDGAGARWVISIDEIY